MKDFKEHIDFIIYIIFYDTRIFLELKERKIQHIIGYKDIGILFVLILLEIY